MRVEGFGGVLLGQLPPSCGRKRAVTGVACHRGRYLGAQVGDEFGFAAGGDGSIPGSIDVEEMESAWLRQVPDLPAFGNRPDCPPIAR